SGGTPTLRVSLPILGTTQGSVGVPLKYPVIVSGGAPPYSYSTTGWPGTLLPGVNGVPSHLLYAPAAASTTPVSFSVKVTDSLGHTATAGSSFTVSPLNVSPGTLPNGMVGASYSAALTAAGG